MFLTNIYTIVHSLIKPVTFSIRYIFFVMVEVSCKPNTSKDRVIYDTLSQITINTLRPFESCFAIQTETS